MTKVVNYFCMLEVFLDALIDSAKILAFVFIFHFLFSFVEDKVVRILEGKKRLGPVVGSVFGLIPECGTSIVASSLFGHGHISIGTLVAVFLSCSDEALPILFSSFSSTWYMSFVLIGLKLGIAIIIGLTTDLIFFKFNSNIDEHLEECDHDEGVHHGCCGHEIEGNGNKWKEHLLHPLLHSFKVFGIVFVLNFIFGTIIYYVGEENISNFLLSNFTLSPLLATLVGLIPNCASSVLLSTLYIQGALPFGALLSGLLVNAGLGILMLFKNKSKLKEALIVLAICIASSLIFGYAFLYVF